MAAVETRWECDINCPSISLALEGALKYLMSYFIYLLFLTEEHG